METFTHDQVCALLFSRNVEIESTADHDFFNEASGLIDALKQEYSLDDVDANEISKDVSAMLALHRGICKISPATWRRIAQWAKESDNLHGWQRSLSFRIGGHLESGHGVSFSQSLHAKDMLDEIRYIGFRKLGDPIGSELKLAIGTFQEWNDRLFAFPKPRTKVLTELTSYSKLFSRSDSAQTRMFKSHHIGSAVLFRVLDVPYDYDAVFSDASKLFHCLLAKGLVEPIELDDISKQVFSVLQDIEATSESLPATWFAISDWARGNSKFPKWMGREARKLGNAIQSSRKITPTEAITSKSIIEKAMQLGYVYNQSRKSKQAESSKINQFEHTDQSNSMPSNDSAESIEELRTRISSVPSEVWFQIAKWGVETKNLEMEQCQRASSIGIDVAAGIKLSFAQATDGENTLNIARARGFEL